MMEKPTPTQVDRPRICCICGEMYTEYLWCQFICPACDERRIQNKMSANLAALMDISVVFGLKAQGHIPTIERMLKENKTWVEIGKTINWDGETARQHYERYKL